MKRIVYFFDKFSMVPRIIRTFRNWPIILLHFLGLFNLSLFSLGPHMICTMRNGVKFKVRTEAQGTDLIPVLEIWLDERYTPSPKTNITDNSIVIDIGAHIGSFSVLAATLASSIKVYAYEPEPENFRLLLDNIKLNNLENHIIPFKAAVVGGAKDSKRKFYTANRSVGHTFFTFRRDKYIFVNCLTLQDVFHSNAIESCELLKIDSEGSEYEILFNTHEKLFKKIKRIHLEYHEGPSNDYTHEDLVDFLKRAGFEIRVKPLKSPPGIRYGCIYAERVTSALQRPR